MNDAAIELVRVRGEGGVIITMALPLHEAIAGRIEKGFLTLVTDDGDPVAKDIERPALYASKPAWIGWAVHNGANPDDAEAATKADLIEKY